MTARNPAGQLRNLLQFEACLLRWSWLPDSLEITRRMLPLRCSLNECFNAKEESPKVDKARQDVLDAERDAEEIRKAALDVSP
jgi:hypothetical protein